MTGESIPMDVEAFKKKYARKRKDTDWAYDVASYARWSEFLKKYPDSQLAKERIEQLKAKWPGKL